MMSQISAGSRIWARAAGNLIDGEPDTMKPFDWKRKFDAPFTVIDSHDGFDRYHIVNETGDGTITACTVFSGIQAVKLDFRLHRCDNLLRMDKNVIEIAYCLDGRFESTVNKRLFHFVSAGDLSLACSGKKESHGAFPTGQYQGINYFLEPEPFVRNHAALLHDLEISLERIQTLASFTPRCFVLHHNHALDAIQKAIADGFSTQSVPWLKIKTMELLLFLSSLRDEEANDSPAYLNKNNVALAKAAHKLLTANPARHTTIEQLAAGLGAGTTSLKTSFKSVYGIPIYQYRKELRLQRAQQLLRETSLPVAAIATETGYTNPAKFSSAFRNRFGLPPTEYRKQNGAGKK